MKSDTLLVDATDATDVALRGGEAAGLATLGPRLARAAADPDDRS